MLLLMSLWVSQGLVGLITRCIVCDEEPCFGPYSEMVLKFSDGELHAYVIAPG